MGTETTRTDPVKISDTRLGMTVVTTKEDTIEYDYDELKAMKRKLEADLAAINTDYAAKIAEIVGLIAEAEKLGITSRRVP